MISAACPKHAGGDASLTVLRPGLSQMLIEEYLEKAHHRKVGISRLLSCSMSLTTDRTKAKDDLTNNATSSDIFCGIPGAVWLFGLVPLLGAAELSACRTASQVLVKSVTNLTVAQALGETVRQRLESATCFSLSLEDGDGSRQHAKDLIKTALQSMVQIHAMELESLVESVLYAESQSISAVLALTEILLGEVTPSSPPGRILAQDASVVLKKLCHLDYESIEPSVILRLRRHVSAKSFDAWLEPHREQPQALTALQQLILGTWQMHAAEAAVWEDVASTAAISDKVVQELRQSVYQAAFVERFYCLLKSPTRTRQIIEESKVPLPNSVAYKKKSPHNKRDRCMHGNSHAEARPRRTQQHTQWKSESGWYDYNSRSWRKAKGWW